MIDYDAKQAYQDSVEAAVYDAKRFTSWRGRIGDALDKRALSQAVAALTQSQSGSLKLLDIPCGTGRITRFLAEQGHWVVGADVSREMMQQAQAKVAGFKDLGGFYQSDAAELGLTDDSFDCVVSIRFMGHIPRPVRARILSAFFRISRYAIIEYSIKSSVVTLRRGIERYLKTGLSLPQRWPWHIFDRQELYDELSRAGFRVLNMWPKARCLSDSWYVLTERTGT